MKSKRKRILSIACTSKESNKQKMKKVYLNNTQPMS